MISIRSYGIITKSMMGSNVKVECMVRQSSSQYGGIRSAINHVYILERVQMLERKKTISTFISVMERTVIAEKHTLGIKFSEGKNHQPQGI